MDRSGLRPGGRAKHRHRQHFARTHVEPGVLKLALAACVCFLSGMLFTWPTRTNPDRGLALNSTLPVRFFFWSAAGIAVLFCCSWYFTDLVQQAAPFISSRSVQSF